MKKTRFWITILVVFTLGIIFLLAYSKIGILPRYGTAPDDVSVEDFVAIISSDRESAAFDKYNETSNQKYLHFYDELADKALIAQLKFSGKSPTDLLSQYVMLSGSISVEEAEEDVNALFLAFKYGYCLYEYFGGDAVFDVAKTQLLSDIENHSAGRDSIRKRLFRRLIIENLSFIQDGHVVIAGKQLLKRHQFYYNEQISFTQDSDGYFTMLQGERFYINRIESEQGQFEIDLTQAENATNQDNDHGIDAYLKLSLNEKGQLVYILGTLAQSNKLFIPVQVTLWNGQITKVKNLVLRRTSAISFVQPRTYKRYVKDNVTVVVNRNTAPSTEKMRTDLELFISEAERIADTNIAILDIRNHEGGQWDPTREWAEILAGQSITYDKHESKLRTRMALNLQRNFIAWYHRDNENRRILSDNNIRTQLGRLESYNPEDDPVWFTQHFLDTQPDLLKNDTRLYVLIDQGTASAGEDFI